MQTLKSFNIKIQTLLLAMIFLVAGCAKEYSFESGGKRQAIGNWEFKDSTSEYMGTIDTAFIIGAGLTNQLTFSGKSLNGNQMFIMSLMGESFGIGSYRASLNEVTMTYDEGSTPIYKVNQVTGEFTVNITSVSGNLFTGTFKGKAQDSTGAQKDLFEGKFKFTFDNASEPVSSGIFGSVSGNCQPVTLGGNYVKGEAMTAQNTAEVEVTVTQPGLYNIFSETVDGITFSGTGVFSAAGTQKVVLTANGTASTAGDKKFVIHYGNSQCEFTVPFTATGGSYDYFPLTTNSEWRYGHDADSIVMQVISQKKNIGPNEFSQLTVNQFSPSTGAKDTLYFRKQGGNYFTFAKNLVARNFENVTLTEFIILKDNVPVGTSWSSTVIDATIAGTPMKIEVTSTILEKSVPVTIGSFDFMDVIKVKQDILANGSLYMEREVWFARNVGIIHQEISGDIYEIGGYKIF